MEIFQRVSRWFKAQNIYVKVLIVLIVLYLIFYALNVQVPYVPGLEDGGSPRN